MSKQIYHTLSLNSIHPKAKKAKTRTKQNSESMKTNRLSPEILWSVHRIWTLKKYSHILNVSLIADNDMQNVWLQNFTKTF